MADFSLRSRTGNNFPHHTALHITAPRCTTRHNIHFPSPHFTTRHGTLHHVTSQHDTTTMKPKPTFIAGVDAQTLAKRLANATEGEVITYTELSALVGGNVQFKKAYALNTAKSIVLRENQFVFGAQRGVGIIRLTPELTVNDAESRTKSVKRKIARTTRRLTTSPASSFALVVVRIDCSSLCWLEGARQSASAPSVLATMPCLSLSFSESRL